MLMLTRRFDEAITIDDNVSVIMLEMKGSQIRLGLDAPVDVGIHHQEIYNKIHSGIELESQRSK